MRKIFSLLLICLHIFSVYAERIDLKVMEKESNEDVPFASLVIEYPDTLVVNTTNIEGFFSFVPISLPLTIRIKSLGLKETSATITSLPDSIVTFALNIDAKALKEIAVIGSLTTQTNSGISYNMAANRRAQNENALQSMSYVPLVNVDAEGSISVQGSPSYSLYVNGRPYELGQTSPKVFLESMPASSIAKVEVITHPDNRFGTNSQKYILNIVLKQPILNGYVLNISGGGNTQPCANGSIMGLIKKNRVDIAINYAYNLNGQRHQPTNIVYTEKDLNGDTTNIWKNEGEGDGNWHTHTLRTMLKWEFDSINTLYADAHGQIMQTNMTVDNVQSALFSNNGIRETFIRNRSEFTSGSAEANLIFRNFFRNDPETERITVGYHYTYNPDRRHLIQNKMIDGIKCPEYIQRTDGGLSTHTGMLSYLFRPSLFHSVRFTASDMYRRGHTTSTYSYYDSMEEQGNSIRYTNNISALNITYSGWIGRVFCAVSAKGNYDQISMSLPNTPSFDYLSNHLYFLPSASFFWRLDNYNALYLDYTTNLIRPAIDMLNPFESSLNNLSVNRGNPNLKAQYNHQLAATWYLTKFKHLTVAASLQYEHMTKVILSDYYVENEKMVHSYSNFGKANQAEMSVNIGYEPVNWLSLTINGGIGKRWLWDKTESLDQTDITYRITPHLDFYLPNHFRIGGKYGFYKNMPNPWSTRSALSTYSVYINKSFLSGRLNITVTANSPFNKYIHSSVITTLPTMTTNQNNFLIGRSFGLSLSYSFSEGQKINLKRDRTLDSSDLKTGVN